MDRYEAEDIAKGSPLSGPDKLIDRIEDGLSEAWDAGAEEARPEAYKEALDDVATEFDLDGKIPEDPVKAVEWIVEQVKLSQQEALNEAYNEALDDLADRLDTKRAIEEAKSMYRGMEG